MDDLDVDRPLYFVTAYPTPTRYFVTAQLMPTQYFVTAQPTPTHYFVTAKDKDFDTPQTRILINKETDLTYLRFAGFL